MESAIKRAIDVNDYINKKQPIPDGLKHWTGSKRMAYVRENLNKYLSVTGEPYNLDVTNMCSAQFVALQSALINIKNQKAAADKDTEPQKSDIEDEQNNTDAIRNIKAELLKLNISQLCSVAHWLFDIISWKSGLQRSTGTL
jgi:hypothetical protein